MRKREEGSLSFGATISTNSTEGERKSDPNKTAPSNTDQNKDAVNGDGPCQVFVSHAGNGGMKTSFALPLGETLERANVSCFVDHRNLAPGDNAQQIMISRLEEAKLIVILLDEHYFFNSHYCMKELVISLKRHEKGETLVFPVFFSPYPNFMRRAVQMLDNKEYEEVYDWTKVLRITGLSLYENKDLRVNHIAASVIHFLQYGSMLNASQLREKKEAKDILFQLNAGCKRVEQVTKKPMPWKGESIIYSGEMVDGKREGYGEAYSGDKKKIYAGKWSNGEPNGKGEEYSIDSRVRYRGEFKDGKYHGHGEKIAYRVGGRGPSPQWISFVLYKGEFFEGEYHGVGILYSKNGEIIHEGTFVHGHNAQKKARLQTEEPAAEEAEPIQVFTDMPDIVRIVQADSGLEHVFERGISSRDLLSLNTIKAWKHSIKCRSLTLFYTGESVVYLIPPCASRVYVHDSKPGAQPRHLRPPASLKHVRRWESDKNVDTNYPFPNKGNYGMVNFLIWTDKWQNAREDRSICRPRISELYKL